MKTLKRLYGDESGHQFVEYSLLMALVILMVAGMICLMGRCNPLFRI